MVAENEAFILLTFENSWLIIRSMEIILFGKRDEICQKKRNQVLFLNGSNFTEGQFRCTEDD